MGGLARARPVVVLGGRGGGTIAALSIDARFEAIGDLELAGFLNDELVIGTDLWGVAVLGPFEAWSDLPPETQFLAPLHASGAMCERRIRIQGLEIPAERWATVIDPRAIISSDVSIGYGALIGPNAMLGHSARIGRCSAVRHGAHVGHDVKLGAFSFAGVNSVIGGHATVGDCVHVAPGATVRDRVIVGDGSVVGLGAVVISDLNSGSIVAGNPAGPVRSNGAH